MIYFIILIHILFYHCLTAEIFSSTAHIKQELKRIRQDKTIRMIKSILDKHDSDLTNVKR